MAGFATLCWIDMKCADPAELAEFYWTWTSMTSRPRSSGAGSSARANRTSSLATAIGGRCCSTRPGTRSACAELRRPRHNAPSARAYVLYVFHFVSFHGRYREFTKRGRWGHA